VSVRFVEQRRNLVPNPRAIGGVGWSNTFSGGTQSFSALTGGTGHPAGLTTAFRVTYNTAATGVACSVNYGAGGSPQIISVTAGQAYSGSIYGRTSRAGQTAACRLTWLNDAGTAVGSAVVGPSSTTGANTWVRYSVIGTAPTGATRVRLDYYFSAGTVWAAGDTQEATGGLVEARSSGLGAYFDGTTAASGDPNTVGTLSYAWTGTPDASPSVERLSAVGTAVTATAEPANPVPRVRVDVVDSGGATAVTVTRLHPDGRTFPVRTADGGPLPLTASGSDQVGTLYDYEAPFGVPVIYSTTETVTGTSPATLTVGDVWLIHPGVPELSQPVDFYADSFKEEAWGVDQGVFWPMGRDTPVVQTAGMRRAASSSLTVAVEAAGELAALRALVRDAGTLYLNVPPGLIDGVEPCYIAVGNISVRRLSSIGSDVLRAVDMPYQVVDRPVGGTTAERNWSDVIADNATWADVIARYDTWADLLAGP